MGKYFGTWLVNYFLKPINQSRRGALLHLRILLFGDVSPEALGWHDERNYSIHQF